MNTDNKLAEQAELRDSHPDSLEEQEIEMALIRCRKCSEAMQITELHREPHLIGLQGEPKDTVIGFILCARCGTRNAFSLYADAITPLVSGLTTTLSGSVPLMAQMFYDEAQLCVVSGAGRGAAVLCRAAIEEALEQRALRIGSSTTELRPHTRLRRWGIESMR